MQERLRSPIKGVPNKIYFIHADLGLSNILVDAGKLLDLIDFGCGGYYPQYGEYTKAKFGPDSAWKNLLSAMCSEMLTRKNSKQSKSCGLSINLLVGVDVVFMSYHRGYTLRIFNIHVFGQIAHSEIFKIVLGVSTHHDRSSQSPTCCQRGLASSRPIPTTCIFASF